jgi:hypothetical protein
MVAELRKKESDTNPEQKKNQILELKNKVIRVVIHYLGTCRTFGENMVFMPNRASKSSLDILLSIFLSLERNNTDLKLLVLKDPLRYILHQ